MSEQTIVWRRPRATDGVGNVAENSDRPKMRPMTGPRATNARLAKRLDEALASLEGSTCSFWACRGPQHPRRMMTCVKCSAMRDIAAVQASLIARETAF